MSVSGNVMDRIRRVVQCATVASGVLVASVATLLLLDRVHAAPRPVDPGIASVDTTRRSRLVIVIIDSWRYETAVDSTHMPQLAALRRRGASWKMDGVYEGFTIPAVHAAYTGHAETQLVNVIQNFRVRALAVPSFFLDAERAGKRTLSVAIEPLRQFGTHYEERVPEKGAHDLYAVDRMREPIALSGFRNGSFDVVVLHYESADWVAHEGGIHTPRYRAEMAHADSMIATFAAALGSNDYLLVHGDHGHNEQGEHKTGLYIPTFGLLLGPDVTPALTLPHVPITNIRFLASHAMGITLRPAPYDMDLISQIIPALGATQATMAATSTAPSRALGDYVIAIAALLVAIAFPWWLSRKAPPPGITPGMVVAVTMVFAAELLAQVAGARIATAFPVLLLALGLALIWQKRTRVAGMVVAVTGAWFIWQMGGGAIWGTALRVPTTVASIVPLYFAAIGAKLFMLSAGSMRRLPLAAGWTAILAFVEFHVWDHPIIYGVALAAAVAFRILATDADHRRTGNIAVLSVITYFTLRLPLFELAWLDLFLAAIWLVARERDDAWRDALIVTGAFAFTSTWLQSGLEWGFLYTLFPAHVVELQVQYFVPFILAKLPIVLLLALVVARAVPTRRLLRILLACVALRFIFAWSMRLAGVPATEVWPLAEQGAYLVTLATAALAWALFRGTEPTALPSSCA